MQVSKREKCFDRPTYVLLDLLKAAVWVANAIDDVKYSQTRWNDLLASIKLLNYAI